MSYSITREITATQIGNSLLNVYLISSSWGDIVESTQVQVPAGLFVYGSCECHNPLKGYCEVEYKAKTSCELIISCNSYDHCLYIGNGP